MPELPEVETVRRTLAAGLLGRRIASVSRVGWPRTIAAPAADVFQERVHDRLVTGLERRGKYIVIRLDQGESLVVHLRMTGRLTLHDAVDEANAHTHVVFQLVDGGQLFFEDQRKFGRIWLLGNADLEALFAHLGPEPLEEVFTRATFHVLLRGRKGRLKPLLLDQSLVAGLGNIYVDEALWTARLHPLRTVVSLTDDDVDRLYDAIREVLHEAVLRRGTSFSDYRDAWGESGSNQDFLHVYSRTGQPCPRCSTPIEKIVVAQRGTHICPHCQSSSAEPVADSVTHESSVS